MISTTSTTPCDFVTYYFNQAVGNAFVFGLRLNIDSGIGLGMITGPVEPGE